MTTATLSPSPLRVATEPHRDRRDLAASLLGLEAALYLVTAVEAMAMAGFSGNIRAGGALTSFLLTVVLLILRARIRTGRFRFVRGLHWLFLVWAAVDLALAVFLAGTGLLLVAVLTRVILPGAIFFTVPKQRKDNK
ncbi:MAG: hypothetical protein ACRDWA_02340 [Acidimicrobiia bacterium]